MQERIATVSDEERGLGPLLPSDYQGGVLPLTAPHLRVYTRVPIHQIGIGDGGMPGSMTLGSDGKALGWLVAHGDTFEGAHVGDIGCGVGM